MNMCGRVCLILLNTDKTDKNRITIVKRVCYRHMHIQLQNVKLLTSVRPKANKINIFIADKESISKAT